LFDVKQITYITLEEVFKNHRQYRICLSRHVRSRQDVMLSGTCVAVVPLSALLINMRHLLLRQSTNRPFRSSHYVIGDAQCFALLALGVSATNPLSLKLSINCRTELRRDAWHPANASDLICVFTSMMKRAFSHRRNSVALSPQWNYTD
jgi:hypothetical protein